MYVALVDLDGTLADVSKFEHLVQGKKRNFEEFHFSAMNAPMNQPLKNVLLRLNELGIQTVIVSGRPERWRAQTERWLSKNGLQFSELHLRANSDQNSDRQVKMGMLDQISKRSQPVIAFDDSPSIIELWRVSGIPTVFVSGSVNEFGKVFGGENA